MIESIAKYTCTLISCHLCSCDTLYAHRNERCHSLVINIVVFMLKLTPPTENLIYLQYHRHAKS